MTIYPVINDIQIWAFMTKEGWYEHSCMGPVVNMNRNPFPHHKKQFHMDYTPKKSKYSTSKLERIITTL